MTDTATPPAAANAPKRSGGRWKIAALAVVVIVAAGGGGGYFYVTRMAPHAPAEAAKQEQPLPIYVEIKPFVVSVMSDSGATRFVQLGVNLKLFRPGPANLINAMLPDIADTMRLTVLRFKVEDITTPAGLDKLREAITGDLNRMLVQRLGAQRVEAANGGQRDAIENVVFATLFVE
jgi:flagellar FliL protein